jgi:4-hydroxy-tetrahydrodipicolinate synthase
MENADLQGVFGVVPTPLKNSGEVDEAGLAHLVRHCRDSGLHAAVILGSNGEFPYFSFEEKARILRVAARAAEGGIPLVGCASAANTREAVALARVCLKEGYAAAMSALLLYFQPDFEAVKAHFETLAREGGLPIIFYYFPETTNLALAPDEIAEIAELPGIHGAKITVFNRPFIKRIVKLTRTQLWAVFVGSSFLLHDTLKCGGAGCICPLPVIAPQPCLEIFELMKRGKFNQARAAQDKFSGSLPILNGRDVPAAVNVPYFRAATMRPYAGPPERTVSAVAMVKEALRLLGHPITARVRAPQSQLTAPQAKLVKRTLKAQGWL